MVLVIVFTNSMHNMHNITVPFNIIVTSGGFGLAWLDVLSCLLSNNFVSGKIAL